MILTLIVVVLLFAAGGKPASVFLPNRGCKKKKIIAKKNKIFIRFFNIRYVTFVFVQNNQLTKYLY